MRRLAVVLLGGLMVASCDFATAQEASDSVETSPRYSVASICGNYGAIATYGANVARALGWETMNGRGKLTGRALVNQPGPNDTRTVSSIGIAGTYTVKTDGTGKMVLSIALPNGGTASVTEDFVITRSKVVDGVPIATEIQDAQEQPSAVIDNSGLVIHSYTLRGAPATCSRER
jgi:hypothetical protein